jgi:acyl-CoA oxidase
MGLNGVDNGKIWFEGVRVPRTALLNRFADVTPAGVYESEIENPNRRFFTMLGTLVQGRVCVGGAGINAAKVALTIATKYALRRRQFEATSEDVEELLLDYGLHQRRLFPLLARTYALHFAQEVVAGQLHDVFSDAEETPNTEKTRRQLESRAAGTKALGTWHATRTIPECREACGGAGYLSENRFAALKADTDVFTTFEGDNHVLLQLVAKGLLTDYASGFEDLDQLGMVKFVANLGVETVLEKTGVHKLLERIKDVLPGGAEGWDQEAGLLDPEYQLAMLRFREDHMLGGVARRLKRGIDDGLNPGVVFSRVQDHVIGAARAHVERLVLEAFVARCRDLPDGEQKVALNLLCDLHALYTIEADRAWFMEHGRLSSTRSKAITRELNSLCRKIRPLAEDYVDAFGVPVEMLRSPDLVGIPA